ncbi:MAG TPA: WGR domain-containing protein [Pirellulales bacterium]|jgi:predicted DNA-binding WGR domain protein
MLNLLTVVFEAHHTGRNHHRRYQISVGRDLFNDWIVSIDYGRIGQQGQRQRFGHANAVQLQSIIRERLRRRRSAQRRIGCTYQLKELHTFNGFDVEAWLPRALLAEFLQVSSSPEHQRKASGVQGAAMSPGLRERNKQRRR